MKPGLNDRERAILAAARATKNTDSPRMVRHRFLTAIGEIELAQEQRFPMRVRLGGRTDGTLLVRLEIRSRPVWRRVHRVLGLVGRGIPESLGDLVVDPARQRTRPRRGITIAHGFLRRGEFSLEGFLPCR